MSATGLMFPKRKPAHGALVLFDPDKALRRMAVAKVAAEYYSSVNDPDRFYLAVEEQLTQQADFVNWWDTQVEKAQGARGDKRPNERRNRSVTPRLVAGENGMPSRMTLSRWRRKLGTPDRLAKSLGEASVRCWAVCSQERQVVVHELVRYRKNQPRPHMPIRFRYLESRRWLGDVIAAISTPF